MHGEFWICIHVFCFAGNWFGLMIGILTKKIPNEDIVRVYTHGAYMCYFVCFWLVGIFCGNFSKTKYLISFYFDSISLDFICRFLICVEDFVNIKYLICFSNYGDLNRKIIQSVFWFCHFFIILSNELFCRKWKFKFLILSHLIIFSFYLDLFL